MSNRTFEMATAYVAVMPSLEGIERELSSQISKALPGMDSALSKGMSASLKKAGSIGASDLVGGLSRGVDSVGNKIFSTLGGAFSSAGSLLTNTLSTGLNAAVGVVGGGVAAIVGKAATGGLTRSLGLNEADARLTALGYSASEISGIMEAAGNAIDGTAYAMNESVGTAAQLLSAGVKDTTLLQSSLSNVAKLSDISGASFSDMGNIFAKAAAKGKVQYEDLVQLMERQVPIMSELSKSMGVPVEEVQSLATAGKISFSDFQKAVEQINFDSVVFATKDVGMAWKNVMSQVSKTGAIFWQPIVDNMAPALGIIRQSIIDIRNDPAIKGLLDNAVSEIESKMESINKLLSKFGEGIGSKSQLDKKVKEWISKFNDFRDSIRGVEGILGGLGLAMSSGFLSKIPVIGGMFGGITLGVGALGGALLDVYSKSELLRGSLGSLNDYAVSGLGSLDISGLFDPKSIGDHLAKLVGSIQRAFGSIFENIELDGFSFTPFINGVIDQLRYFVEMVSANGDEIGQVITDIVSVFSSISTSVDTKDVISGLVSSVVTGLQALPPVLELLLQLGTGFVGFFTAVGSSDITKTAIGWIVNLLKWIVDNDLGTMAGVAIGGIYSVMKILPLIKTIGGFIPSLTGLFSGGKAMVAGLSGFIASIAAAGQAAISGAVGLAAIAALVLGIGALIWALEKMDVFTTLTTISMDIIEIIMSMVDGITNAIGKIWPAFEPIATFLRDNIMILLTWISDTLKGAVQIIGSVLGELITIISDSFAKAVGSVQQLIETISTSISSGLESLSGFLVVLSDQGFTAGAGAISAAGGITALAGALALLTGGEILNSIGGLVSGGVSKIGDMLGVGDNNGLQSLIDSAEVLNTFSSEIENMPALWSSVTSQAFSSGLLLMSSFGDGLLVGLRTAEQRIMAEVRSMMSRIQTSVSSTPVNLRVQSAGSISGGSTTNNTNNSYSIRTTNSSVAKTLIKAARGARRY